MKIYKISSVATRVSRRGKILTIKNYHGINHAESIVISSQKNYVNLIHGEDHHRYSCLIENIKEIKHIHDGSNPPDVAVNIC